MFDILPWKKKRKGSSQELQRNIDNTYEQFFGPTYGYFKRTIELPAEVDPNKVDASYKRGILKIKLRKTKSSETKRITLTTG